MMEITGRYKEFALRLRQACEHAGVSLQQKAVGKAFGVSATMAWNYLNGEKMPSTSRAAEIAKRLDVSFDWLMTGRGNMLAHKTVAEGAASYRTLPEGRPVVEWENPEDLPEGRYVLVERRKVKLSAGNGQLVFEDEPEGWLAFTTKWMKRANLRHSDLVIVEAKGDSMEPYICDGDILLVDLGHKEVANGEIYAIRYGDELLVKRLTRRYDGAIILNSDNPKYPQEVIPPDVIDVDVAVIGRVVWRAGGVV